MSKAKGGTGRGTGKKGWNRWQASAKKKAVKKIYGKNQDAKDRGAAASTTKDGSLTDR
ncbi:hypothetical protein D3C78_985750 [compost metagenome]